MMSDMSATGGAAPGQDLAAQIRARLQALQATRLEIIDESHLHAGHAAAMAGGRHFRLKILSEQFCGKNTVARHRLVYDCVRDLMPHPLHALAIEAGAPPKGNS